MAGTFAWSRNAAAVAKSLAWPLAGRGGGGTVEEKRVVDHGGSGARRGRGRPGRARKNESRCSSTEPTPPPRPAERPRRVGSAEVRSSRTGT